MNWVNLSKKDILYTAIGFLLKDSNQENIDFIVQNKDKMNLNDSIASTKDGKSYSVKEYVVDVLKNEELAKDLGLQ